MSFMKIPDELLLEIGSYLLPKSPQLADKPCHTWIDTIRCHGQTHPAQARDYSAFGRTCKRLYDVLPRKSTHAHIPNLNIELISSVLKNSDIHSLSTDNLFGGWESQKSDFLEPSPSTRELIKILLRHNRPERTHIIPPSENHSIHTLYLLDCQISAAPFKWLLDQLKGLKTLYIDYMFDASPEEHPPIYLSGDLDSIMRLLTNQAKSLEKLVFTKRNMKYECLSYGLERFASPIKLASLSIGSFLLIGDNGIYNDSREVHKLLPSTLKELEVIWEDGTQYPFMSHFDAVGERPEWLFQLLKEKKNSTPQLERARLISNEEWFPGIEESVVWDGGFEASPKDWTEKDGNENWRPPTELITAAEKAQVSFGIWLHPQRQFKAVLPGCKWFADSWEDTWSSVDDVTGLEGGTDSK